MKQAKMTGYMPALLLAFLLCAIWEIVVRAGLVSARVLPAPGAVIVALAENWDILLGHTIQTAFETMLGLGCAIILGLVFAIVLNTSSWMRRAVYPLLVVSQTIPMVALAPLLIIWFGLDLSPKVIVVTLYCFFPIAIACADGILGIDRNLIKLLESMGASRWQILRMVRLPGAMPAFFSGLRIAATYSVTGAIVGEYVAAYRGLGLYMKTAANASAISLVFAAIIIIAILSLGLFGLVACIERLALPWYHRTLHKK